MSKWLLLSKMLSIIFVADTVWKFQLKGDKSWGLFISNTKKKYSYFNLRCWIKASSLQDNTEGEYGILMNNDVRLKLWSNNVNWNNFKKKNCQGSI